MKQHYLYFVLLPLLFFIGCKKEERSIKEAPAEKAKRIDPGFVENDMVMYWNDKISTVLGAGMNQPTRSRFFAIMHIAMHDALNSIKPKYEAYALTNYREKNASPDAAVASAGYWVIKGLNRQGSFPLDKWYSESLATIPEGESKEQGKQLGKVAAEAIIANRINDGFSQVAPTSLTPPNGTAPGAYRQTNLNNVRFIPTWGTLVRPFVISSNSQFRPDGPYELNSAAYATDYNEIKVKGARVNSTRTADEQMIAQFWAENRPSIIWNNFIRGVISQRKIDAWKTARLFALLYTAMADGINTVMESKYHFYFWRPETAIREGNNDGNNATEAVPGWLPNLLEAPSTIPLAQFVSPPIPEYPAGSTVYGGVVEEIFHWFLNTDNVSVTLSSNSLPGTVLQYNSISKAAQDNINGKIYAGWYFRKAAEDGYQLGRDIAVYVIKNSFRADEEAASEITD